MSVISRLIPHAANFTLVGASVIYVSRRYGFLIAAIFAVLVMVFTDIFLGFNFTSVFVYTGFAAYAISALIGRNRIWGLAAAPITGSFLFFLISNFGVWVGPWYPHTVSGFVSCFIAAIPFYQNMVAADLIFTAVIFSLEFVYKNHVKTKISEGLWDKRLAKTILIKR